MSQNLYTGTLIFCIIAAVVSVVIICLFFFINVQPVKFMLLTIELILIIIIVHSILTIIFYEKSIKKYNEAAHDQEIINLGCPDYFTRRKDGTTNLCENIYDTKKNMIVIGEDTISINISDMGKKTTYEACKEYSTQYANSLPWTDLKSSCETVA